MIAATNARATLAATFNEACHCIWVDRAKLRRQLQADLGPDAGVLETREGLVSGHVVFVAPDDAARMDRAIRLVTRALESEVFERKVAAEAPAIARARSPASGGVLGFDFHLGGPVPQLIEINTNPGGLLVAFELARAATASCECLAAPLPELTSAGVALDSLPTRVVENFRTEWIRARGTGRVLQTVAIVDADPGGQYLYPEFLLYRNLLERSGLRVLVVDPAELTVDDDALRCRGERIDLVYNRLTDFYLADERHAALRQAYVRDLAVIAPHPAAHARWADKRLLNWLRDESMLEEAGLSAVDRRAVLAAIPPTEIVGLGQASDLWARRKTLFFKPIDGFAGKAAYRGDKLTRTAFEQILDRQYVAQAIAPTSFRRVGAADGAETELRVDVRNFAVGGETWLRAARLYRGQTTNFRTTGGGFAPVLTM
jgi:hypothetical protein